MSQSHAGSMANAVETTGGLVRFGTFAVRLDTEEPFWAGVMLRRFRATPSPDGEAVPDLVLRVGSSQAMPRAYDRDDELTIERHGARTRLVSELMTLDLDAAPNPMRATLSVRPYEGAEPWLEHGFAVFLHKVLQACGVVRLHAAAVECAGDTHVFVGDKGAGKSTIALALGRAGGRVLGDDQLVVRRRGSQMAVSGCDTFTRLTEKSEQHFFDRPLALPPQDFAGVLKKEVGLEGLVDAIPYQDRMARSLYFPRVGHSFAVRPMSRREAAIRVLDFIAPAHAFAGPEDRWDLLRLVTDFVNPLECAELELSPDLPELDRLIQHLLP